MNKFVPYEKRSKRAKKEADRLQRGGWGAVNPVTRRPANPKAYKRKNPRLDEDTFTNGDFLCQNGTILL